MREHSLGSFMSIDVFCPECEHELHLPDERMLGRWARCPQCQVKFQLLRPEKSPVPKSADPVSPPLEEKLHADESDDSEECVQTLEDVSDVGFDDLSFDFSDPPEAEELHDADQSGNSSAEDLERRGAESSGSLPPALFEELFGRRSFDAKKFVEVPPEQKGEQLPTEQPTPEPQPQPLPPTGHPSRTQTIWIVVSAFLIGSLLGFGLWWLLQRGSV